MDTLGPIAEVRVMSFCLSSPEPTSALSSTRLQRRQMTLFQPSPRCICLRYCRNIEFQTLLEQYQRDDNIRTLLEAVHDAFDFAHHEDTLKSIKPESKPAKILTLMLQDICSCCDFIQSYAKDSQFCMFSSPTSLATTEPMTHMLAIVVGRRPFSKKY